MINTPTTFIIGAGASSSYGLPTGLGLLQRARALRAGSSLFQVLRQRFSIDQIQQFIHELQNLPEPIRSIDSFLEKRQHVPQTMAIGRAVIALLMGHAISNRVDPKKDDWWSYMFQRMHGGAATYQAFVEGNRHVRFVTFNFDSLIQQHLHRDVSGTFHDAPASSELLEPLVIHVHGRLPDVPKEPLKSDSESFPSTWADWMQHAPDAVRVVHDDFTDDPVVQRAREAVEQAAVVCFLGFAYEPTNLRRLGLPFKPTQIPDVFGSMSGLPRGEQYGLPRAVGRTITLPNDDWKCLDTLKNFDIFR